MRLFKFFMVFLIINFGALALGVILMENGPQTDWYLELKKAPWTPPGWVFGAAWSFIMVCFSVYMAYLYKKFPSVDILVLFVIQFILNVSWNFVFFNQHLVSIGLVVILLLTSIVTAFLIANFKTLKIKSLLILPYFIWLCVATSLNAYIVLNN